MSLSEHNQACRRPGAGSVLLLAAAALCVLLNQCESLSRTGQEFFFFFSQWSNIFTINILPHLIIQTTINHKSVSKAQSYLERGYKPRRIIQPLKSHFKSIRLCFFRCYRKKGNVCFSRAAYYTSRLPSVGCFTNNL